MDLISPSMVAARRMFARELLPRIFLRLLQAQRNAALVGIHFQHLHVDFGARRDDLGRRHVLLHPAHFADMDEAFHARLQLHKGAVVGDVGDLAA